MFDLEAAKEKAPRLAGDNPIQWGHFLAIDEQLQLAGAPPVPDLLLDAWLDFLRSGATTFCLGAGQRSTKSTSAMRLSCLPEIFLSPYQVSSGATPVWPIVSHNITEASERIKNLEHFLKLLRFIELPRRTKTADKIGLDKGQFVQAGGTDLHLVDGSGNPTIIRVTARDIGAVSGFTGRGSALCDEVALWDHGENASRTPVTEHILETLAGRGARQGETKLLLVGRLFSPADALSTRCREGSTPDRYVVRLGQKGAERDYAGRQWLAAYYRREALKAPGQTQKNLYSSLAEDPRLHEPPNPGAYAIPGWACFPDGPEREGCPTKAEAPVSPERAMAECRRLAGASIRNQKDILDGIMRAYGSRGYEAGAHAWIDAECCEAVRPPSVGSNGYTMAQMIAAAADYERALTQNHEIRRD